MLSLKLLVGCLALISLPLTLSTIVDNGVLGAPKVKCEDHEMIMEFTMEKPFNGRIFVKGMADRLECSTKFHATANQANVVYKLRNGECNMQKQRRVGPQRGIEQSMTVIVSFHDTFITKIDRAYRCTCFFMETEKPVTSEFEVSDLATTDLIDTAKMPSCTYRVRRGSINGPAVNLANVGETVYHVWQCDSDMFGMLVHSCYVDDGTGGDKFKLHNENGCAVDRTIVDNLQYNEMTNQAFVASEVFKFADKPNVFFQCSISLCMKSDGACLGLTPPQCKVDNNDQRPSRSRRGATSKHARRHLANDTLFNVQIAADKISVFDIKEEPSQGSTNARVNYLPSDENADQSSMGEGSCVCVPVTFISIAMALLLLAISIATIFILRTAGKRAKSVEN